MPKIILESKQTSKLNAEMIEQINNLTLDQIESLGDALLDFDLLEDLTSWLSENRS